VLQGCRRGCCCVAGLQKRVLLCCRATTIVLLPAVAPATNSVSSYQQRSFESVRIDKGYGQSVTRPQHPCLPQTQVTNNTPASHDQGCHAQPAVTAKHTRDTSVGSRVQPGSSLLQNPACQLALDPACQGGHLTVPAQDCCHRVKVGAICSPCPQSQHIRPCYGGCYCCRHHHRRRRCCCCITPAPC
jgi:hypothetical protein